jgi:Electron transfer DM13
MTRRTVVPALATLLVVAAFGLYFFQPWKAFTNTAVEESLPESAPGQRITPAEESAETGDAGSGENDGPAKPAEPRELARGSFVSHEYDTSGAARTVELADGGRVLRFEDLKTSEGPDVRVYLSKQDASAVEKNLGEGAVELAGLKGNIGNQNYAVPADVDLSEYRSAVIWCERFSVSFGAADLAASA